MKLSRAHLRLSSWITMIVMLFAVLAPGIATAMAMQRGEVVLPGMICSASKTVHGADGAPLNGTHSSGMQHCAFCLTHAGDAPLPVAEFSLSVLPAATAAYPSLFYQSRFLTHIWSPSVARAPPRG
ncbi:DUF2946 domain-containing protein [Undibacterium squillarum]|uniref:DUF2946 domain-containing protein n=1 Tax=Undibacterium squillarum TaxID=1131567 RepID=UPI0035B1CB87